MIYTVSKWAPARMLVAFPLVCLVLTLYLIHNPPYTEPAEVAEMSPPPTVKARPAMAEISHIPERTQVFIDVLLPLIEWRNHELRQSREELVAMYASVLADTPLTR